MYSNVVASSLMLADFTLWLIAQGDGDPHITTLDGFKYTFSGKGEFLLIDHVNGRFTLQGRMADIPSEVLGQFGSQQATVF